MTGSWLCPTETDRARVLDANGRVRIIRMVGSGAVGGALLLATPWLGDWTLILFGLSVLNFVSVERRMAASPHPERVSARAILVTLALLAAGVVLSGGPKSPALPWLVLPAGMAAARFRPQVVVTGLVLTVLVVFAVTFGVDARATLHNPVSLLTTLALLTAVVSIVWALETAELYQRGEATIDPLTGLANRRQLAEDLRAVWSGAGEGRTMRLLMFDLDGFKAYNDTFGHLGGDLLLGRVARALDRAVGKEGRAFRLGGDEFCALLWGACGEDMVQACTRALTEEGKGFSITSSYGSVMLPAEASNDDQALQLADERMYACKESSRASAVTQTRDLALRILAAHEPGLHEHSSHVAELAEGVAVRLGLTGADLANTVRAAELHDIGKLAIPYGVLHKAGPLDEDEWELMRRHPIIGASILAAAPALKAVAEVVGSTHERYDGTGYPRGLAGEQIPLAARIVFVCDAYDAMVSERPFGEARSEDEAVGEVLKCAGTQFDPRVMEAFMAELAERRSRAGDAARAHAA
jgi:two-component system cell cycle response regulator